MATFQYNPADVSLVLVHPTLGAHIVVGYADGSFIRGSRSQANFSKKSSSDGKVITRSKRNDKTGMVVIQLEAASPSNAFLQDCMDLDETSDEGIFALSCKDSNGGDRIDSSQAWITQPADQEHATESGTREWNIDLAEAGIQNRGATQL
jgi:hypothetical protein